MVSRPILASAVAVAALFWVRGARADEGEHIRLSYEAPAQCPREVDFVGRVASLGQPVRPPVGLGAVRRFVVSIEPADAGAFVGRLIVTDVWDEETAREISGKKCEDIATSLALFVALALEAPPAERPPRVYAKRDDERDEPAPDDEETDLGRGGIALGLLIGGSDANADAVERGLHARVAFHAPRDRSARYGFALQLTTD